MSRPWWLLSLFVPALLGVAGPAHAQSTEQYVVIYVEFLPQEAKHGKKLLDDLTSQSLNSAGVINFSSLGENNRDNRFALVERWSSAQAYQTYKASSTWTTFLLQAQPLLGAPLDERDGVLLK